MSEQDEKDPRILHIRKDLKNIEAKIPILKDYIPEKDIRGCITVWRSLLSNPQVAKHKKHPEIDKSYAEWMRHNIPRFLEYIEYHPLQSTSEIGRLKTLLEFPERYHDHWDDINPQLDKEGNPMMNIQQFWDFSLKEAQRTKNTDSDYVQTEMDPIDGKMFKNRYKKYMKEWKEEND